MLTLGDWKQNTTSGKGGKETVFPLFSEIFLSLNFEYIISYFNLTIFL
jgi:hypothetical protein